MRAKRQRGPKLGAMDSDEALIRAWIVGVDLCAGAAPPGSRHRHELISASARASRRAAAVLLAGALASLLAACGSSSPSSVSLAGNHNKPNNSIHSAGSSAVNGGGAPSGAGSPGGAGSAYTKMIGVSTPNEVALAVCVRKHGFPSFPDPNAQGVWSLNGNGAWQTPQFRKAELTCAELLQIKNAMPPSAAQQAAQAAQLLKYSECMRSHGVPKFPDPSGDNLSVSVSQIDPNSPIVKRASNRCSHLAAGGGVALATP